MRYKEYNINRVLEKCIQLFWRKGFKGCSVKDIVEETGVNRFSLYHEFEDKEGILYNSLKLYKERYTEPKLEVLNKKGDVDEILYTFLMSFLKLTNEQQGCYFIHIGTELADSDSKIKDLMREYLSQIENSIKMVLEQNGETSEDSMFFSRHLIGLFCTSMSFCLILPKEQKEYLITNGINLILNQKNYHASNYK